MTDDVKQRAIEDLENTVPGYPSDAARDAHEERRRARRESQKNCPRCGSGALATFRDKVRCSSCGKKVSG